MPIYEYKRFDCGEISEVFLRGFDAEAECSVCGGKNLERLLSASYSIRMDASMPGKTCCGRTERCETPALLH